MKKTLVSLFIVIISCSTTDENNVSTHEPYKYNYNRVDNKIRPYVKRFIKESQKFNIRPSRFRSLDVKFEKFESSIIGFCLVTPLHKDISIDKEWWETNKYDDLKKEQLVFHELGHCVLYRSHTDKPNQYNNGFWTWLERLGFDLSIFTSKQKLSDGCPASYMHPYELSHNCIKKHRNYYIKELFSRN